MRSSWFDCLFLLTPHRPAAPDAQSPTPSPPAFRTPNHNNSAGSARIPHSALPLTLGTTANAPRPPMASRLNAHAARCAWCRRPRFAFPFFTSLISTLLPKACATRINVAIVKFRGSFSIAEIFGALISASAANCVWLSLSEARSLAICTPNCRLSSSRSTISRSSGSSICF